MRGYLLEGSTEQWSALASERNVLAAFTALTRDHAAKCARAVAIVVTTDVEPDSVNAADVERVARAEVQAFRAHGGKVWHVHVGSRAPRSESLAALFDGELRVPCAAEEPAVELASKWVFNAVSTCAHVIKGAVFGNRMVNLGVSNQKLFYRAVTIVQDVARAPQEVDDISRLGLKHYFSYY